MAPLSLKIVLDKGAVTKTLMFDTTDKVEHVHQIVREKITTIDHNKGYGFFLTSADDETSGFWLESDRTLEYYMLRDGDPLYYLPKMRNLRLRMLDGSVKTIQVDESKCIGDLISHVCNRIGIPDNEEYGFCREECNSPDESKPTTGTLTLKKKTIHREKDALLEQLSKKLKTDDNVEWLDQHKTLRECRVEPDETLLFKRRLFYSDRNVDARDPVQLNLLYVQTRDAILDGRQIVTEDKAAEFAGIQCQVQYGDFQEDKHKPGFIENLREFLPEQYASSWGIEKKIIKEHRKHHGVSHLDAKHLYTKTARELPTYGVTFFLVKEKQKGKKKLIPRLIGINSESILRLDEATKEILQVWPLTQVKSYRAGIEFFTLNFGDYSDKEYSVKTNEAFRIRDILQGYIDIIRKRLAAPYNVHYSEGEAICEDMVESSRGTYTQNVVATKPTITTFVGPSQIISAEQGHKYQEGTTIITAHKLITTSRGEWTQLPMRKESSQSNNTPHDLGRKLNRLNSEAVRTVVLLSDPTQKNLQEVCKIIDGFEDDLPSLLKGVNETASKLKEDESKKLLEELDELCNYINTLASTRKSDLSNPDNLMKAQDSAKKITDLSTQMFFSLDPKTKRRSQLLRHSRNSFILDEKTEASLRRASFITATDNACQAVENAKAEITEDYNGPPLSEEELKRLDSKTVERMGKLNAAIALLLNAHADPNNIDYEMAMNSMKTINELMPDFIKDSKPLICTRDENAKRKLRGQIIQLLDGTQNMCLLTGSNDVYKMYNEGNSYADVAKKLIFTFKRSDRQKPENDALDQENQILAQAKVIGEKVSLLLKESEELNDLERNDPHSESLDAAGAKCVDATQGFLTCAKLTAPSIQEPHCQSALTAAAENLSSTTKNLALTFKPLVDKPGRHGFSKQLADRVFDLAKALDKLKDTYAHLKAERNIPEEEESNLQRKERLKFIMSSSDSKNVLKDAEKELQDILQTLTEPSTRPASKNPDTRRFLSQNMAQLNAAIASLIQATSDANNPDYDTAGTAVNTICQLTPTIINDTKALRGHVDDNSWQEIAESLKEMLEATRGICTNVENCDIEELNKAGSKLANSSGKLTFIISPRRNAKTEDEIQDLSKSAVDQTAQLLAHVDQLAKKVGGEEGSKLDTAGVRVVDAAQQLLKTAEITAPSIEDARCQSALLAAIDRLSDRARKVEQTWKPVVETLQYRPYGEELNHCLKQLNSTLDKLRKACQAKGDWGSEVQQKEQNDFIITSAAAKNDLNDADKHLQELIKMEPSTRTASKNPDARRLLAQKMAQLNAAIAFLAQATSDAESPDYKTAGAAVKNICQLTPMIIKDTKEIQGNVDGNSWKELTESLKEILEATRGICDSAEDCNIDELNEAASKIANSSGKLTFIINPRRNVKKQNEVKQLSESSVDQTAQLLAHVDQLAKKIGGEEGTKLDTAGVKVVDAAQQLLKTAEITAPSIEDARCQSALLSAIDHLSDRARKVEQTWKPLVEKPEHGPHGEQLSNCLKQLNSTLDKLKQACQSKGDEESEEQKVARHNFIVASAVSKRDLNDADKDLQELIKTGPSTRTASKNPDARRLLSQKMAQLNAAIASLAQATSDSESPDYKTAGAAVKNICQLAPMIINDTKELQGNVDGNSWKEITESLKEILEATRGICGSAEDCNIEELNEAASKIANSSGKLTFIINPRRNVKKQNEVKQLSESSVDQTAQLLAHVDQLAKKIGGEEGTKLDTAGVKVVDAAQQLLKTAEITAPSIEDARCQSALLSAIDRLSDRARKVEQTWKPLVENPEHRPHGEQLNNCLKQLNSTLDKLKQACQSKGDEESEQQKVARHNFIVTSAAAKSDLKEADKDLQELIKTRPSTRTASKNPDARRLLSQKMAQLNAAIAYLAQATSDADAPDYNTAEKAIKNICQLTPKIINDTKALQGNVDGNSWKEITENLKEILEATRGICGSAEDCNIDELNEAASKIANSSGKLTFIINPRRDVKKQEEVKQLSKSAVDQTSQLLARVDNLAKNIGGEEGSKLDTAGVKVVDAAQQLLKTAKITAPSIEDTHCQSALLHAIYRLGDCAKTVEQIWRPIVQKPEHQQAGEELKHNLKQWNSTLDKLKEVCQAKDQEKHDIGNLGTEIGEDKERQRIQFVKNLKRVKDSMANAAKEIKVADLDLNRPQKNKNPVSKSLLAQKLANLNASIASMLQATSDRENQDYEKAGKAVNTISDLTTDIIKDAKTLQGNVDDKSWKLITDNLKAIVDTTSDICDKADDQEELEKSALEFANSVNKMSNLLNPRNNEKKENKILGLSREAAEQLSLLLSNVYQLAEGIDGDDGEKLDKVGVKVVNSVQIMLKTTEITSPTISNTECQQALLSSVGQVTRLTNDLKTTWNPHVHVPKHRQIGHQLEDNLKIVQTILDKLRTAVQESEEDSKPHLLSDLSDAKKKIKDAEKLFSEGKIYEQRALQTKTKNTDKVEKPVLEQRLQLSQKLAQLNEAVALLLQAMSDRQNPDYKTAEKTISIISNLTPEVVQETIGINGNMDDNSREVLFKEAKKLCNASQEICTCVENNDLEELNKAATNYAHSSGKLHFIVSPRSYPNKEKKILDLTRSVCERTSLMLSRVSRLACDIDEKQGNDLNVSGAKVADSAHILLSTAQVTAPSMSDRNCQLALMSSADTLSDVAQDLENIWKPLVQNPKNKQFGEQLTRDMDLLNNELKVLKKSCQDNTDFNEPLNTTHQKTTSKPEEERGPKADSNMQNIDILLEDIYNNSKNVNKPEKPIVIEDTPLRQLASKIMESAKIKAESSQYSEKERKIFAELANKLADAINKLDVTNSRCRDTPFGSKEKNERALQLENAILNLQLLCIQSRQKDGEASNIVDLTEFVDDVTSAVGDLQKTTKAIKGESKKEAISEVITKCQKMQENANQLLEAQNTNTDGNMFDDVLRIDQFAKDCGDNVQEINNIIRTIGDEKAKNNILNRLLLLEEKCNLLRFAAKSSISNAESATLEESLRNLEDTEKRIEMILKPTEEINIQQNVKEEVHKQSIEAAQSSLAGVIAAGDENKLPKALARYAVQMKSFNQTNNKTSKLKEHLDRLLDILKLQIAVKNRRVVTWQDMNDEEVYTTTEKVLQELDSFANDIDVNYKSPKETATSDEVEILKEADIKSLLAPNTSKVLGEPKELKIKLNQQIQKLNSMIGTIMLSLNKPESLARTLHTTSETAAQLSSIARGLKNQDPVQNKRIEEAAQEVNVATYQLMKTAKSASHAPTHPESRRRLLEACNLLNDSLNNIARAAIPADKMQRDCNELMSSLQLHQSFLTSEHPFCALSYPDCVAALQTQQDIINKLKSEQSMSRTECGTALRYVSSAICNSAEYASQSAYLLTLSKEDQKAAKLGLVDVPFVKKLTDSINETCIEIICNGGDKETKDQAALNKQVHQLQEAVNNASTKMRVEDKNKLLSHSRELHEALKGLNDVLSQSLVEEEKTTARAMKVLDAVDKINTTIDNTPERKTDKDPKATASSKEVLDNTRNLLNKTSMMIRKASLWREEVMTWVTFGSSDVIKAFESLVTCLREKGAEAGLIETIKSSEEPDAPAKSYIQTQLESAISWLRRPASKDNVKAEGVKGAENVVNMAEQMCEDLQGSEKEEMKQVIDETKKLLKDCTVKYNSDKAGLLTERLKELRKMLERGVVTRVVEDFLEDEPLADLENIVHKENDEKKRNFLLEKKLAELLAQLGRVKKTARFVADTGKAHRQKLMETSDQVELLAPSLVKAAQQRIKHPDDKAAIEHYQKLLAEYAESLCRIRELCDKAVDPIEFSQAAGETMQRIKEESSNDPNYSSRSPKVFIKLYKRVVDVGINSDLVQKDPDLKKTLADMKSTAEVKDWEAKRADSWKDITAEILRRTGQVESALGGENIFLKKPEHDQPIYAAAHNLHSAVRGWSARDNEIVAVAKKTAVLMAKLSDYMNTGNKSELIFTSNSIVTASREVAELAKKLALECSDIRIRTNLLQVCDRIPTISGQLKMLTTVKSSSLGHQGSVEDQEAMNMLVGNAQNLMTSIQEVVKAAAGASVKIMSQRGCRLKWVQRTYY